MFYAMNKSVTMAVQELNPNSSKTDKFELKMAQNYFCKPMLKTIKCCMVFDKQ